MGELPTNDVEQQIKIRKSITQILTEHPEGLCPREIFEILNELYTKHDIKEVLAIMWNEDNSMLGSDRKLRIKPKSK